MRNLVVYIMAKIRIFQTLTIAFILSACAPVLFSPDDSGDSDYSFLALLGMGGSSEGGTGVSPDDAGNGGTTAPVEVGDPLQAEAEALLGISIHGNTSCYPLYQYGILNRTGISACKYIINGVNKVKFYPIYNGMVGDQSKNSEYSKTHIEDCEKMPNAQNHSWHNDNAVVEYAMNLCYGDYVEPEPTSEKSFEMVNWLAMAGSGTIQARETFDGVRTHSKKVYPETTQFWMSFNEMLVCDLPEDQLKNLFQLWKKGNGGNWNQIDHVYTTCHNNLLYLGFKDWKDVFYSESLIYDLNEYYLEPNSTYRLLISADIKSQKGSKLGVVNSLGDFLSNGEWSGFEFQTTNKPCFETHFDRWRVQYASCVYEGFNESGERTDLGCTLLSYHKDLEAQQCNPSMFPDIDFYKTKTTDTYQIKRYHVSDGVKDCHRYIWSPISSGAELDKVQSCVVNPGTPKEYTRIYIPGKTKSLISDCNGLQRAAPNFNYENRFEYYDKYRRAGCKGEPDPDPNPDPEPIPDPACKNTVSLQTDGGRWFETPASSYTNANGGTVKIKGIHSFWQNEPLQLNINACKTGWYNLAMQAKNHAGPKPDFYGAYHLNISDKNSNREYGLAIPASDERYYSRKTLVYLQKGVNTFESLWTNDAYLEGVYDANLQIKSVRIVPFDGTPPNLNTTRKAGKDFCQTNGRFFGNGQSIVAEISGQEAKYCFEGLESGEYKMIVVAKNKGLLPEGFHNFRVRVKMNGNEVGIVDIPAESEKYNRGNIKFNVYGSQTNISLSWINGHTTTDGAKPQFELKAIRLKKEGAVSQSFLAAYLKSGSMMRIVVILILSSMILGITLWLRRRHLRKAQV